MANDRPDEGGLAHTRERIAVRDTADSNRTDDPKSDVVEINSGGIVAKNVQHPDLSRSTKEARERSRQYLSLASFSLLAVVVLGILATVAFGWRTWPQMSGVTAALLPAVTSVATAGLTFYFAKRDRGS